MESEDYSVIFYGIMTTVFVVAVVVICYRFFTASQSVQIVSAGDSNPMSPSTRRSLNYLCSRMRDAEKTLVE